MLHTVITLLFLSAISQVATTFDLSTDFSLQHNPNGVWQYGYSASNSLDLKEFRLDGYADQAAPIGFWHPSFSKGPGPGWYPYIAHNSSKNTMFGSSNGWAARAGEVAMEASNTGQYSLVRFVAPMAGTYQISAQFEGIHFGLSSTDVHVISNDTQLFSADIDGYGGDPAFHKVEGASPTAAFSGKLTLKKGDIVTFAVGYGKNKTNFGDTTGLFVHIVLL
ncbi:hypothetical protein [Acidobacterium sp. S8]|uniref:hypothetical protein n=1 Tax=Acidobacterium sp. S8 TaxID=1641854 RepID=UPI00131E9805|nr:hypothetical protein [Acidobacterium sp. S8]